MRWLSTLVLCLAMSSVSIAQQNTSDTPATKEDVQRYFEVMHFRENMQNMMKAMSQSIKEMAHERCAKQTEESPEKCEASANSHLDTSLQSLPLDEMIEAMAPILQKHMTKGDIDACVAFYASPTGQKMMREQPAITVEAMRAMQPILNKRMESMQKEVEDQLAALTKDSEKKSAAPTAK